MRYAPNQYAEAFSAVVAKAPASKNTELVKRFLRSVRKNGDFSRMSQIMTAIERRLVAERGGEWVRLEFARSQPERVLTGLRKRFGMHDHIAVAVRPELIAGVRITRNEETELDHSLARKLKKLFSRSLPDR